jgi:hypothetical protein
MNQHPMPTALQPTPRRAAWLALAAASVILLNSSPVQAGSWEDEKNDNNSILTYSDEASVLGQEVPFSVRFVCNTTSEKDMEGTLGFDIDIKDATSVTDFPFADFEGPDAVEGATVKATLTRSEGAPLTITQVSNGSFSDSNIFTFNVSELSKKKKSSLRTMLEALAKPDAESLQLVVSDPRRSGRSFALNIPVAGREDDFQELLEGLK